MDTPRPTPDTISIEQMSANLERPTFSEAVGLVRQATYEFRQAYAAQDDAELPVVRSYDTPLEQIDIISQRPLHAIVQVSSLETNARTMYECDPSQEFALVVSNFDASSGEPKERYGVQPSQDGTTLLLNVQRYIRDATV